jgi:molybdopterin biosynthesis enzyme
MAADNVQKGKKLLSKKRKLQRQFVEQAKAYGLSAVEVAERASIFPKNAKLKVVKWPKF